MKQRICKQCGIGKNITAFPIRKAPNGTPYRRHTCSNCKSKSWRTKNPDKSKTISKRAKLKYQKNRPNMKKQLMEHIGQIKCKNCNNDDLGVLCFHHRYPSTKSFDIHWGFTHSYSFNKLKLEVEKCDVLCANCHTILHYLGGKCKHTEHAKRANQNLSMKYMLMQNINQTSCLQCGFDKIEALVFHHKFDKNFTISEAIGKLSFYDLLSEVIKCDVLCMNCHLLKHSI